MISFYCLKEIAKCFKYKISIKETDLGRGVLLYKKQKNLKKIFLKYYLN